MPLQDETLSSALQSINARMLSAAKTGTPWTDEQYCDALASAFDAQTRTLTLSIPGAGLVAPSGGGTVTGVSITGTAS